MEALTAALFLAAYAPYALTNAYTPTALGVMNRTHGLGVWAAAIGAAWALRKKPVALVALAIFWSFYSMRHTSQWAKSWALQKEIVVQLKSCATGLPDKGHLLVDAPARIGVADIFTSFWDFSRALRFATGRSDIEANILLPGRVPLVKEFLRCCVFSDSGGHVYTKENTYIYDWEAKKCMAAR